MHVAANRELESVEMFPAQAEPSHQLFVVRLRPRGYAVLNRDERLPLVVSYSPTSLVDLADVPENAFRSTLLRHSRHIASTLEQLAEEPSQEPALASTAEVQPMTVLLYGPYLETAWGQNHPYNLYTQEDTVDPKPYYGGRVPAGCTPTAFASVAHFHRWPLYGRGAHSYSDAVGSITGLHSAVFSDPFNWSAMQTAYDPWAETQPGDTAVADLIYRLGVAVEADYESHVTRSSVALLADRIRGHLFYEQPEYHKDQKALLPALEADLVAGFPAVVNIPGHAVVADGLLLEGTNKQYHIDYGWGGVNTGWWSADHVAGAPLSSGATSIRPLLMPFPVDQSVTALEDQAFALNWIVPRRREQNLARLHILELSQQGGDWTHAAETFDHAVPLNWILRAGEGRNSTACWYAGPNGYAVLDLEDTWVPDATTQLQFWMQYRLHSAAFSVSVSLDNGETYREIFRRDDEKWLNWELYSVGLGQYEGHPIRIRLELHKGATYYTNGGIWLDDLAVVGGSWFRWVPFAIDDTLANRRFSEVRTLWDACSDFSLFEKTSTDTDFDWTIAPGEFDGNSFFKRAGGYSNREYHITSLHPISPTASTRLQLRWKREFYDDTFRVLVSHDRAHFTDILTIGGSAGWQNLAIDLSGYAGQSIYVRLEYMVDAFYEDGGVWINAIYIQDVSNPELEGQPVYYTRLEGIAEGTYRLAAAIEDQDETLHRISPPFDLQIMPLFETRSSGGTVTLVAYRGSASKVVIPDTVNGMPVTGIEPNAIQHTNALTIIVPASITNIAQSAFANATGAERIYFLGDAPATGPDAFPSATTLYYTLHSSGWASALEGRPTQLWNAIIEPGFMGFAENPGHFSFRLTGPPGHQAMIQALDNLTNPEWETLGTALLGEGATVFTDETAGDASFRAYRVLVPSLD